MSKEGPKTSWPTLGDGVDLDADTIASREETVVAGEERELAPGSRAGRYLILDRIGRGGMGVVYQAYDPELDRRIALKVLRVAGGAGTVGQRARERLLREAKALAQLSHPNVVSAYDVGTLGQDVFVAMELVEGQTLKKWIRAEKPSEWQRVKVLLAAGRGLMAAHEAGLIHRDIKPDNIIVGRDGRVRVLDFGLARAATGEADESQSAAPGAEPRLSGELNSEGSFLGTPISLAGAVVGTPGYMAPEQYQGIAVDEKTDQYSFCVTLHEALVGKRPFTARRYGELKQKVMQGTMDSSLAEAKMRARYRRIVLRGLKVDKDQRYQSMAQLLAELSVDPRAQRRRWLGSVAVLLLVTASFAGAYLLQARKQRLCAGGEERLAGVWDDPMRARVKESFLASDRPYAKDSFTRVEKILNALAADWVAMHRDSCEATQLRGEQSEGLLDLRTRCLDRRLGEMGALTNLFADQADGEVVAKAVQAAHSLGTLDACADTEALTALVSPPRDPALRDRVNKLRADLDRARALEKAGKYQEGLEQAVAIATAAADTGYAALRAEALFALGTLQARTAQSDQAEASLQAAIQNAAEAKDDKLMAQAATALVYVLGYHQARHRKAMDLGLLAAAMVTRAGNPANLRADLEKNLGIVLTGQRKFDEARAHLEKALAVSEVKADSAQPEIAGILNNLGNAMFFQGKLPEAGQYYRRAIEIWKRSLGSRHPELALSTNNLGSVLHKQGKYQQALVHYEAALAIWLAALGDQHPRVAMVSNNLGVLYNHLHRYQEGLSHCQRAVTAGEASMAPDHPNHAYHLTCLADALVGLARSPEAIAPYQRALALWESSTADENTLAETRFALARTLWASGKNRPHALILARKAQQSYAQAGEQKKVELAKIKSWLRNK